MAKRKNRARYGYSYDDIARESGSSSGAVRSEFSVRKIDPSNLGLVVTYITKRRMEMLLPKRATSVRGAKNE
jgi:hypothetical protein